MQTKTAARAGSFLLLAALILCGIILGGIAAAAAKDVPFLGFLAYSKTFGLSVAKPALLDLSVLKLSFGCELSISVAQVLCIAAAILIYRRIR